MLRGLAILGVLSLGIGNFARPQVVGNGRKQEQQAKPNTKSPEISPGSQIQARPAEQENKPQSKPYQWRELYTPTNIPNWALAALAGWAGIMALKTLRAINRQGDIQRAAMQQWVDVEAVTTRSSDLTYGFGELNESVEMTIDFMAVNNTDYPLTINKIVTKVSRKRIQGHPKWEVFEVDENIILPPNRRGTISSHPFYIPLVLERAAVDFFNEGQFLCSVSGEVFFKDCLEEPKTQWFGGMYQCGPDKVSVLPYRGTEPTIKEDTQPHRQDQKAN